MCIMIPMEKENKPKMGRPKSTNPQDKTLPKVRVTREQLDTYKTESKRDGKTLSAWVRDNLDGAVRGSTGKVESGGQGGGTI